MDELTASWQRADHDPSQTHDDNCLTLETPDMYPHKYRPFPPVALPRRSWPDRVIQRAPAWLSTDLRDGNQALAEPMDVARKLRLWERLVAIGFQEIEVAFPSASQTDFDFVRQLIEEGRIPDDVTIQVLIPAREALIERSVEALRGAPRAIMHLYNAVSPLFRGLVFQKTCAQTIDMAVRAMTHMTALARTQPQTEWRFQYSPEAFSTTELDFSRDIVDAVSEVLAPSPGRKLIVNLPATVEAASPNVFADQVEWMHRHLARREAITLSVHTHNDRGSAVAAAELALMAGAERVEGCLFGHGERTGNACLVTLAMNLYSQGIDPGLDFSHMDAVRECTEQCTRLPVHPRHPYAGELVYTAFSGSHQDAIRKGLTAQDPHGAWQVPYLPVDPRDVGRSYQAVIRVNSQSGKGGIAHVLERDYGLGLPRGMQIELRHAVQALADESARELSPEEIHEVLEREYLARTVPWCYRAHQLHGLDTGSAALAIRVELERDGRPVEVRGQGQGPIEAFVTGLDQGLQVRDYHEHAVGEGAGALAAAYVALRFPDGAEHWGMGSDVNIVTASLKAILSAVNRHQAAVVSPAPRAAVG
jgi:2-isopropylmalate synthase